MANRRIKVFLKQRLVNLFLQQFYSLFNLVIILVCFSLVINVLMLNQFIYLGGLLLLNWLLFILGFSNWEQRLFNSIANVIAFVLFTLSSIFFIILNYKFFQAQRQLLLHFLVNKIPILSILNLLLINEQRRSCWNLC